MADRESREEKGGNERRKSIGKEQREGWGISQAGGLERLVTEA